MPCSIILPSIISVKPIYMHGLAEINDSYSYSYSYKLFYLPPPTLGGLCSQGLGRYTQDNVIFWAGEEGVGTRGSNGNWSRPLQLESSLCATRNALHVITFRALKNRQFFLKNH